MGKQGTRGRFAITWICTLECGCIVDRETPARGCWWSYPRSVKHACAAVGAQP